MLVHLSYPLEKDKILVDYDSLKSQSIGYTDYRLEGKSIEYWKIVRYSNEYIEKIIRDFEIEAKSRIYFLNSNTNIPLHIDNGTKCSINFVLSDNPSPIIIEGKEYYYTQALLNTTRLHGVVNGNEERILLKLSIFNETFEELSSRIKYKV